MHQSHVSGHDGVFGLVVPRDLVDNELRVTEDLELFGSHVLCQSKASQECFVLGLIVGSFEVEPEGTLKASCVGTLGMWSYKDNSRSAPSTYNCHTGMEGSNCGSSTVVGMIAFVTIWSTGVSCVDAACSNVNSETKSAKIVL